MASVSRPEERKLAYNLGWDPDDLLKWQRSHIKSIIHDPEAERKREETKEIKRM